MITNIDTEQWPATKRKIVDAGVSLMRAHGYNATSLDEICAEAGVTKGALFHYFRSKDEIARAAIAEFAEAKVREFQNAPFRALPDPLDRVFGRVEFAAESAGQHPKTKGCLIGVLAQELSFTNSEMRRACHEWFTRIAEDFARDLTEARSLHAPTVDFNPQKLATLYVTLVQGSLLVAKAEESTDVVVENLRQFGHYLECLFGQKQKRMRRASVRK